MNLAACDVNFGLRRVAPLTGRGRLPMPVGQRMTLAPIEPRMARPIAVPMWRQALNKPEPIPDHPPGTEAMAPAEPAGTIRAKPTLTRT